MMSVLVTGYSINVVGSWLNPKPRASRAIAMLFALRSAPMKTGITTGT